MSRGLAVAGTALLLAGCNPVIVGELLLIMDATQKETDNFELRNVPDDFYIKADHHDYDAVESYSWVNHGETAMVEGAARPSCPNSITIAIYDAEGERVFLRVFDAPHCWRDKPEHWDPVPTASGTPGTWRIVMTYNITGVRDMWFHIWRVGERLVECHVSERIDGQGHDGQHGDHGCQVVRWTSKDTDDRDVVETCRFKSCGPTANVELDWGAIANGTMEITILDGYGQVVYHRVLGVEEVPPEPETTSNGHPGTWTVILSAQDLTSTGLSITIEG